MAPVPFRSKKIHAVEIHISFLLKSFAYVYPRLSRSSSFFERQIKLNLDQYNFETERIG